MDDILQNLLGLLADSNTPWWARAAVGGMGAAGYLHLRARKQWAEEAAGLHALFRQQLADQAETISQLQREIRQMHSQLLKQQAAELSARDELGKVKAELSLTRQAMDEWTVIWGQLQSVTCGDCPLTHLQPPYFPQGDTP